MPLSLSPLRSLSLLLIAIPNPIRSMSTSSTTTTTTRTTKPAAKSKAAEQSEGTLIVGGGIAGLSTAAALRSIASVSDVRVVERVDDESFRDVNARAAAQLGPNGLRALRAFGGDAAVAKVREAGTELKGNAIVLPGGGGAEEGTPKEIFVPDVALEDEGLPQVLVRWSVLRSVLFDLLPGGTVSTGAGGDVVGYERGAGRDGSSDLKLLARDGSGSTVPASLGDDGLDRRRCTTSTRLIVAADGIRSTFRPLVRDGVAVLPEGDEDAARGADVKDGGRVNVKAVVPVDLGDGFRPGCTYAYFSPGGGAACFAGPAGKGHTYWAISIPDEEGADGEEPSRFLADVDETDGTAAKNALVDKLTGLGTSDCQFVVDLVERTDPDSIYVQRSEEAAGGLGSSDSLSSKDGSVALVGDAAHAMSPSYGQAANFAMEDAAVLACCVRDGDCLKSALEEYGKRRIERCKEMQRRSAERTAKAARGEAAEDVSKWIFDWDVE